MVNDELHSFIDVWRTAASDLVLEDRPWPRGSSRTKNLVLGLGLESSGLGLGLEGRGLGLGLGLEGPGPWPCSWPRGSWPWLQARKFYFVGCFVSMRFANFFKISFKHAVYCRPFSVLLSHHPSFSLAYGLYFISYVYLTLHKYVLLQCLGMGLHQFALFFLAFVDTVNLLTHFVAITVVSYHVVMYLSHHLSSHFFMWENR